jgi:hypothetical protein
MGIKAAYSKDRQTRVVPWGNNQFRLQGRDMKHGGEWFGRGPAMDRDEAMSYLGTVEQPRVVPQDVTDQE